MNELGRGGMGVVWLAVDELIGRQVALKELRAPGGLGADERETFARRALTEARNAARIRHPNAVALHDVIPASEQDNAVYLVMELVHARSLDEVIRVDGPLSDERVTTIALQLLDVLDAAHELGVVHRDVKPANVLLAERDVVKLADFGIAQSVADTRLTRTGLVAGTLAYMAPELYNNAPITPAADLWSLGVTLFHAAQGVSPFERTNAAGMLVAILHEEIPTPACGPRLASALSALLVRDPARRATSEQVRNLLGTAPILAAADPTVLSSPIGAGPAENHPGDDRPADHRTGDDRPADHRTGGDRPGDHQPASHPTPTEPEDTRVMPSPSNVGAEAAPTLAMAGGPTPPHQGPPPPMPPSPKRGPSTATVAILAILGSVIAVAALIAGLILSTNHGSPNPTPAALTTSSAPLPIPTDTSAPAPVPTSESPAPPATTDSTSQGTLETGPHYLVNDATSGCLDQDYGDGTPHSDVLSYPCNYDSNESWNVTLNSDGSYSLVNAATGECLNQDYSDGYAHDDVIVYPCGTNQNQNWQVIETGGTIFLKNEQSGGCLDQDYGDGTPHLDVLAYSPCDFNSNEGWTEQ